MPLYLSWQSVPAVLTVFCINSENMPSTMNLYVAVDADVGAADESNKQIGMMIIMMMMMVMILITVKEYNTSVDYLRSFHVGTITCVDSR